MKHSQILLPELQKGLLLLQLLKWSRPLKYW